LYPEDVAGLVLVDPTPDTAHIVGGRSPEARALPDTMKQARASKVPLGVPVFLIRAEGSPEVPFATRSIRTARLARQSDIAAESREHKAWIAGIAPGRLIVTEDSGHNVEIEQPDLVVDTVRRAIEAAGSRAKQGVRQ
jgi:pimeloyl-ACP methyl ester carboxylesterase